ncbi:hypothetical protein [Primorskyibacter sp. S87]|uniref:hypothetical protein n=1 Tax=Primorskyibacter sp. S87 TaxID=3415126 RepID=UPI003C7B21FD
MRYFLTIFLSFALVATSGCGRIRDGSGQWFGNTEPETDAAESASGTDAGSAAEAEEGQEAEAATEISGAGWVGAKATIASLGDPARPGLWLETPLVSQEQPGRVVVKASGVSVNLTLIPSPGDAEGSGRLSLQAMQTLGAPLTELVPVDVYSG